MDNCQVFHNLKFLRLSTQVFNLSPYLYMQMVSILALRINHFIFTKIRQHSVLRSDVTLNISNTNKISIFYCQNVYINFLSKAVATFWKIFNAQNLNFFWVFSSKILFFKKSSKVAAALEETRHRGWFFIKFGYRKWTSYWGSYPSSAHCDKSHKNCVAVN